MATTPAVGSAPAKLEKKPVKFSNLLCERYQDRLLLYEF